MGESLQEYLDKSPDRIKCFYIKNEGSVQFIQVEKHEYIWGWINHVVDALGIDWDPKLPLHELSTSSGSYSTLGEQSQLVFFFSDDSVLIENRLEPGHPAIFDRLHMTEPMPEEEFFAAAEENDEAESNFTGVSEDDSNPTS